LLATLSIVAVGCRDLPGYEGPGGGSPGVRLVFENTADIDLFVGGDGWFSITDESGNALLLDYGCGCRCNEGCGCASSAAARVSVGERVDDVWDGIAWEEGADGCYTKKGVAGQLTAEVCYAAVPLDAGGYDLCGTETFELGADAEVVLQGSAPPPPAPLVFRMRAASVMSTIWYEPKTCVGSGWINIVPVGADRPLRVEESCDICDCGDVCEPCAADVCTPEPELLSDEWVTWTWDWSVWQNRAEDGQTCETETRPVGVPLQAEFCVWTAFPMGDAPPTCIIRPISPHAGPIEFVAP
jgi:hypothetical protein